MEAYATALNYAIPFFLILILIEMWVARHRGVQVNRGADTISSLSSGITNIVKDVLGLSLAILSYEWMVTHLAIFEIKAVWLTYVIAFVVKDFAGYWMHRLEHEVNFLWNRHIIHHSSEEFNLSCALRQSISSLFSYITLFMMPAALVGVPAEVFSVVAPLHLFAQFWYHTRIIGKMGFLEKIIVTPSHHRVHHAMNKEYLDKNYSQIFIIWDKLFGTFQEELPEVPPVYGVKRPVRTWNPILINFQHFLLLLSDAWRTQKWRDKFRLWFMPTGWRPADVAEKYPVATVENFSNFQKYDTYPSRYLLIYSWAQMVVTLLLMFYLFNRIATLSFDEMLVYGVFLFVCVFGYTTLLDKVSWSVGVSAFRALLAVALVTWQEGDWFGFSEFFLDGGFIVAGFYVVSFLIDVFFVKTECNPVALQQLLVRAKQ